MSERWSWNVMSNLPHCMTVSFGMLCRTYHIVWLWILKCYVVPIILYNCEIWNVMSNLSYFGMLYRIYHMVRLWVLESYVKLLYCMTLSINVMSNYHIEWLSVLECYVEPMILFDLKFWNVMSNLSYCIIVSIGMLCRIYNIVWLWVFEYYVEPIIV